ncbi:MAG: dihydrodipicolinate synthase family protein [Actinobacteria bacterium]|nr:dihydrodipicolinate synthase family protein [Actinomycetota bacterium]MBV8481173.1 dihydrodipicolinate synthase family protein [Actinomycetota bacterium]
MLRGAFAAALTPSSDDAYAPYVDFLAAGGLDGILALGTTGEGMLFSVPERKHVVERFVEAARGTLQVAVNAGAQTTADTVALAAHAAEAGADAVAVIAPPYFPLDDESVLAHMTAAAAACAPTPFYVYEFARASGYAVSSGVLARLREQAPNLVGMKVSDTPYDVFEPYLHEGLDVFVGPEAFIGRGMKAGAVGAVSALASAFPEQVARAVREESDDLVTLRETVERFPRHAALKLVVARRGVPMPPDVRAPLRRLTGNEERALFDALTPWLPDE